MHHSHLGFTLGRHPLALLRARLQRLKLASAAEIRALAQGTPIRAGGLVICRQHSSSANGVIFATSGRRNGPHQ